MATYILLSTLTLEGTDSLKTHPELIEQTNARLESYGIQVVTQYAVLGPYDFVTIVEAPDNRTVVRASAALSLSGTVRLTTLPAVAVEDFLSSLR